MKLKTQLLSLSLVTILLSGCADTIHVYDGKGEPAVDSRVPGVPFYVKKSRIKQETTYSVKYVNVTLNVTEAYTATPQDTETYYTLQKAITYSDFAKLKKKLAELYQSQKGSKDKADELIVAFNNMDAISGPDEVAKDSCKVTEVTNGKSETDAGTETDASTETDTGTENKTYIFPSKAECSLTSNTTSTEVYVDYSKTYYINSPLPWFGSNEVKQTLNDDGTLSSSSANADTGMIDLLSTVLPVSDYITAKYIDPLKSADSTSGIVPDSTDSDEDSTKTKPKTYVPEIKTESVEYTYTFKKTIHEGESTAPIDFDLSTGVFTKTKATATGNATTSSASGASKDTTTIKSTSETTTTKS